MESADKVLQERIARVQEMEARLDKSKAVLAELTEEIQKYYDILDDIAELSNYLGSDDWKDDFDADERGELPKDLKRGVLTEDGIFDVLDADTELRANMADILSKTIRLFL